MGTRVVQHITVQDPNDPTSSIATGETRIIDTRTLDDARADAMARVHQMFNAGDKTGSLVDAGRSYGGKIFQIDANSLANINGAVSAAMLSQQFSIPYSQAWRALDNTSATFDAPGMIQFGLNIAGYISALSLTSFALKDAISSLKTIAACDTFDVTIGWPVN